MTDLGPILRSLRRHKGPSTLLVMEVAMGMAVLAHLLVMGTYYYGVAFAGSGLDEQNLIFVTRRLAGPVQSENSARQRAKSDRAVLANIDGVVGAAVVDEIPLPHMEAFPVVLRGEAPDGSGRAAVAWPLRATEDVVATLGLHPVAGTGFSVADDGVSGSRRALITEQLAGHLFPTGGSGAVGRWIGGDGFPRARIVGVVSDFRIRMPFLPDPQSVVVLDELPVSEHRLVYVARSAPGRVEEVSNAIASAFGVGTGGAGAGVDTVQIPRFDHASPRFHIIARGATIVVGWTCAIVLGVTLFGSLALASFSVSERTRQIGVRRALGARRGQIVGYFLLENAIVTSLGIGLGLVLALAINVPVRRMSPSMAITWPQIATAMGVLWSAGLVSALIPARRGARIPPTAATRSL